jgi:fatty-acyl-CoA synthase
VVAFGDGLTRAGFVGAERLDALAESVRVAAVEERRARVRVRDVAMILYTSGTTASPKGCVHTHEGLVRNGIVTGRTRFLLSPQDRFWDPLPMFHVGFLLPMIAVLDAGATMLTMTHLDGGPALDMMEREHATWLFPAFPAVASTFLDHPTFASRDLTAVRMAMLVGPPKALRRLQEALPCAVQISTYGSTETGGVITYHLATDSAEQRATTCGPPFRGIELRIHDPLTGTEASPGAMGEILVRGYSLLEGYYKDAAATALAIDAEGWLHTGDLGSLDDAGHVTYHGRLKDMLKVGGENVAPAEVEAVISECPGVRVVQVVGAPDDRLDEVVAAFVELSPGAVVTEADIVGFCRGRIAGFKVPRYVRFVQEWPMSATKIQKHVLRERLWAELAQAARGDDAPVWSA